MDRGTFSSHSRYHLPKKRTNTSSQNPTLQTPSFPLEPRNRHGRRPPSSEVSWNYVWSCSLNPPSTSTRNRTQRTYRTPVDRNISLLHLYVLVSIHTTSTLSWGGPRATTHWPQSGYHPVHLFPIPHLGVDSRLPSNSPKNHVFFFFLFSLPFVLSIHIRNKLFNLTFGPGLTDTDTSHLPVYLSWNLPWSTMTY